MKLEGKSVQKQEFVLQCVEHQFCFCKDCVVLDGRGNVKTNDGSQANNNKCIKHLEQEMQCSDTHDVNMHKVSCGSMVRMRKGIFIF
jgi:hypothetical protein